MSIKEIGLLFTPENRSLTRADLKTETRRVAKPKSSVPGPFLCYSEKGEDYPWYFRRRDAQWDSFATADELADHHSPYGGKGKPVRYYVKEPVQVLDLIADRAAIRYQDDGVEARVIITPADYHKLIARQAWWRPSSGLFMLKSFARTWLKRERLWAEKLGDMTEESCFAEGIQRIYDKHCPHMPRFSYGWDELTWTGKAPSQPTPQSAYRHLLESINGDGSWDDDKWVWCVKYSKED